MIPDQLKPYVKYTTALFAALVAANGVLQVVDGGVVTQALGLLAALGLYVLPSPVGKPPAAALLLVCLLGLGLAPAAAQPPPKAVTAARDSVVAVYWYSPRKASAGWDDWHSCGAGFLVKGGYVLTCRHCVVGGAKLSVQLRGKAIRQAALVAESETADLALLSAPVEGRALKLAEAPPVWGEGVVAIGHPYGWTWTITRGVVSALDAPLELNGWSMKLIQTDAPVNPGNSGGPLLNDRGEAVGVVTAVKYDARGIGFAIPAKAARAFLARHLPK